MQDLNKPELGGLEYQIESLLKNLKQLQIENNTLKQKLSKAKNEAQDLSTRNHHAAERIDKVIARLKEDTA